MRGHKASLRSVAALSAVALALVGCGGDDDSPPAADDGAAVVSVSGAWSRQPAAGQSTAAVYAVVSNPTDADVTMVAASSPVSDRVELHETIANDDGTMKMQQAEEGFVVPAGGDFAFESGGAHIMLFGIDPAEYPTDHVEVTLDFDTIDPITFMAEVRPLDESDAGSTDMGSMDMSSTDSSSTDMGSMDMSSTDSSSTDMGSTDTSDGTSGEQAVAIDVTVADGVVSGAGDRVDVPLGATVELTVVADVADEVHVHGYDLHGDVTATSPAVVAFTADIPGLFEVELEDAGLLLVELQVS
jgi:periplasmic copper chaperone A